MRTRNIILFLILLISTFWAKAQESNHWHCDIYEYEYDMTIYFGLQYGNEAIKDLSDYEVAAFVGNECRGVAEIHTLTAADNSTTQYGYLRVRSNLTKEESIYFKAYQLSTGKTLIVSETKPFKNLEMIGLPSSPIILTLFDAVKGDANSDGTVDASDIIEVMNYFMGNPSEKFNDTLADANSDEIINAADVVTIVNIILGN